MKLSIVTTTLNSASTLRDTLYSVQQQLWKDIEHIIVDGSSTDDTLKIVSEFEHVSKVISRADDGIYDAMNQGLARATGDIVLILNSDDVYATNIVIEE